MNRKFFKYSAIIIGGVIISCGYISFKCFLKNVCLLKLSSKKEKKLFDESTLPYEEKIIMQEQLVRTMQFFDTNVLNTFKNAYVVIIGVGGVGSHCAVSLARNGIYNFKLIDFDLISLSSLNRHACATRNEVGLSKIKCLKKFLLQINPFVKVDDVFTCLDESNMQLLLQDNNNRKPDFVIDCIDNIPRKSALIHYCHENNINCISSGGAGAKCDPTKLRVDHLSNTQKDSLCRAIRSYLKKMKSESDPIFIYFSEKENKSLVPLDENKLEKIDEYCLLDKFRLRVIPVIGPLPAIMGNAIASFVLYNLSGYQINFLGKKDDTYVITSKNYKILFELVKQTYNKGGTLKISSKELELSYTQTKFIYCEMFQKKCIFTDKMGSPSTMQIIPWLPKKNSLKESFYYENNLICVTKKLAKKHLSLFEYSNICNEDNNCMIEKLWSKNLIQKVNNFLETHKNSS